MNLLGGCRSKIYIITTVILYNVYLPQPSKFKICNMTKGCCLSFPQTWIPTTQGCFVASLVEIDPVFLGKKILKSCPCNYTLKRGVVLLLKNLIHYHARMLCAKFGWNRTGDSGQKCEKFRTMSTGKFRLRWAKNCNNWYM